MRLSPAILSSLKAGSHVPPTKVPLDLPKYEQSDLSAGIVHVGVGNFHRAHMAAYLDDLFNQGKGMDYGIVGASLFGSTRRDALQPQGWLQTLGARDGSGTKGRILASMMDYLPVQPAQGHPELQKMLVNPDIKIVSLTITEGGYFLDPGSGKFDPNHPDIQHDAANPDAPKTIFGMMLKALKQRKEAGIAPFTILSCDNVMHNGDVVQSVVQGLAQLSDPQLAEWLSENVTYPNGMVDRIVPATTDAEREAVSEFFGYEDAMPVFCEPFTQVGSTACILAEARQASRSVFVVNL
jgi:mannitol 2-dehydrogenase